MTSISMSEPIEPGTHPMTYVSELDGTEQPYNLFVPSAQAEGHPLPLVMALHGHGATWESWFAATKVREWAEKEGFYVVCPQGRGNWFYLDKGEDDVFEVLGEAEKLLNVDKDHVYLIGHSMGGWGTWHTACAHPDVFAAVTPMSAWAPISLVGNLKYTPPLVIHGDSDPMVDVSGSRLGVAALAMEGVSHRYIEAPGVGHESSLISDELPTIGLWLKQFSRETAPKHIHHVAFLPTRGKAWWLSIRAIEPTELGEGWVLNPADVDAQFTAPDTLEISTANVRTLAIDMSQPPLSKLASGMLKLRIDGQDVSLEQESWAGKSVVLSWEERLPVGDAPDLSIPGAEVFAPKGKPAWQAGVTMNEDFPPAEDPLIGRVTTPEQDMLARLAGIATAEAPHCVILLSRSQFLPEFPEKGDLTLKQLVDTYVQPDDSLVQSQRMPMSELKKILDEQEEWKPIWWEDVKAFPEPDFSDPTAEVRVIVPTVLAKRMGGELPGQKPSEPGLRSRIYTQVRKTGSL